MQPRITRKLLVLSVLFLAVSAQATELPLNLSEANIQQCIRTLSIGGQHRPWTAHALRNTGLGLDVGLETTFLFRGDMHELGSGSGVIPKIIPVPKVWASWDLEDFYLSSSFAPGQFFDGLGGVGFGFQWVYFRNKTRGVSASANFNYTYLDSFGDIQSHTTDFMTQVSKDMIFWQPYAGVGFSVANGRVSTEILAPGVDRGPYTVGALHWLVGVRLDFLAKIAFQFDFVNLTPSGSLLLSNSF